MTAEHFIQTEPEEMENIQMDTENRFTMFPIQHADIWDFYIRHKKALWLVDEVDLSKDLKDWQSLNANEKFFIKHVLAFFSASDGIVNENLVLRFYNDIQLAEARAFYSMQIFIENEHSLMYSRLIETYVEDYEEKMKLFNAIEHYPAIQKKANWALKWIQSSKSLGNRLIAFILVEGLFFSGSFCAIFWLREQGIMHGLCASNSFIAADEGLHTDFGIHMYRHYIQNKMAEVQFHQLVREAVAIEKEFILESLPCSLLGMNSNLMSKYIEFVANRICRQLGYAPVFENEQQPFPFMNRICLSTKVNFFDQRSTTYQRTVSESVQPSSELNFDVDF